MANGGLTRIRIDEKALEEAAQRGKGTRAAVNESARKIRDRANSASRGGRTNQFVATAGGGPVGAFGNTGRKPNSGWLKSHPGAKLVGGKYPMYLYKPASSRNHPVAIVYTGNYAAMKFEHEHNGLLKASR